MFERFTEQARHVVALAQEEARLMRHDHVGTEHLLVALARLDDDDATAVLRAHGLTGEKARGEVVRVVGMGDAGERGQLALTPAAHDALQAAVPEAMALGHERVAPAHLLLGILRQPDALARRMLMGAGAAPSDVRDALIRSLDADRAAPAPRPQPQQAVRVRLGDEFVGDLGRPQVDGLLLLEILERGGAVAAWLRERGVDEAAVHRMLGE